MWLKYCDIPGLAMTRSFGDALAGAVGVISEPGNLIDKDAEIKLTILEIMDRYYEEDDKFIVLASDGIWDFMPNEEVIGLVLNIYSNRILKRL